MNANDKLLKLAIVKGYKVQKVLGPVHNILIDNLLIPGGANELDAEPTLYDLKDWLSNTHNIFVTVQIDCTCEPKFCYEIKRFHGNPKKLAEKPWWWETQLEYNTETFYLERTQEQALENGINEALKLLVDD
tara:strand:- start:7 stop:402 length:396 start_codon:yes stop_codon:yes gene_type:complete